MKCLVLGHLVKDIIVKGSDRRLRIGGGAYYSSLVLSRFCEVEVWTSIGDDFPAEWLDDIRSFGVDLKIFPSRSTTVYELRYTSPDRELFLRSVAEPLRELPRKGYEMVIMNPVAGEIPPELVKEAVKRFPLVSLDVQGFIRKPLLGKVSQSTLDASFLRSVKVVHADEKEASHLTGFSPGDVEVFLVSRGGEKGTAYFQGRPYEFEPVKADVVDTTGAGDVFLAAFSYFYTSCPFIQSLKRAVAFTALFLERRSVDISADELGELAKNVSVKRV
ncbi:MAG: carbohydrate kinase [Thermococcus sp.]|nr:carbohydrate kinase [Thermococcus sp.]